MVWDALGCGCLWDTLLSFRLFDFADCLAGFLDALGLRWPHVLGLCFGGGLALELFSRYPRLPRTLVLASAYAGWAGSLPREVVEQRLAQGLRDAELPQEQVARAFLQGLVTGTAPQQLRDDLVAMMSEFHPAGLRAMAHAFAEADLRDVLPDIDVPTLLLYGDADQRSPLAVAEDLYASIPGSTLVVIPGVGHQSNIEAAERFNAEVRSFLGQPRASRTARAWAASIHISQRPDADCRSSRKRYGRRPPNSVWRMCETPPSTDAIRRRGQPIASSISREGARPVGGFGQPVEQLAHQVAATVVEAADLAGVGHGVARRVLPQATCDSGAAVGRGRRARVSRI